MSRVYHIAGDSLVEGVGGRAGGWAQRFAEEEPPGSVSVAGIGGDTSQVLCARLSEELVGGCSTLLIGIGLNDSRFRPSRGTHEILLEDFRVNVVRLVEIAHARRVAKTFFVGLTRVDEARTVPFKEDKIYRNADIARYDEALASVVSGLARADYIAVSGFDVQSDLADGLHPSDAGYRKIYDAVRFTLDE